MEYESKELNGSKKLRPMRKHSRHHSAEGIALVIVLGFLVLITVLVVAFFTSVTTEYSTVKTYTSGASARFLTDTTTNLVIGQIAKATKGLQNGSVYTWASQPGMIRTYGDSLATTTGSCYKLYSSDKMVLDPSDNVLNSMAADVPTGWNTHPANYTDLNAPVTDSAGRLNFPILDGNLKPLTVNGTDVLTYDEDGDGKPDIEGFSIPADSVPNYKKSLAISAVNNPAPMPVQWMYILKDGTLVTPDPASDNSPNKATFLNSTHPPTPENPITGRVAFWTDDDTSKLNLNTASEGTYYAFPHTNSPTDMKAASKTFGYAISPPATGEYNRYPGHPASTCLSVALGHYLGMSPTQVTPSAYSGADPAYLKVLQNFMSLLPKYQYGGSKAGTVDATSSTSAYSTVTIDSDRLFASLDESLFAAPATSDTSRQPFPGLNRSALESLKFFLTTNSRAPELTPFNTPKISMWPQWKTAADRTAYQTPTRSLLAFCSSFGTSSGTTSPSGKNEYFFQRNAATGKVPSWQSSIQDWSQVPRNQQLALYLYHMGAKSIPGYGKAFTPNKYSASAFDNIIVDSLDFIRSNVGKLDYIMPAASGGESYIVPLVVGGGLPGMTGTIKAFGDYPVITQIALGIGNVPTSDASGAPAPQPIPFLIFDTFLPTQTLPGANPTLNIDIQNAEGFGIKPPPNGAKLQGAYHIAGIWDWKNNKTQTMRGWGWAFSISKAANPQYYNFDNTQKTTQIGSGTPVTFIVRDAENNPIQQLKVTFPVVSVPTPIAGQNVSLPWYWKYPSYSGPVSSMFALTNPQAVSVRSIECGPSNALRGDWRLLSAFWDASTIGGQSVFSPTQNYSADYAQAHTLRLGDWWDSKTTEPTCGNNQSKPPTTSTTGSLVSLLKNTDYYDYQAPCVPYGLTAAMNSAGPGDWDTGPGLQPDGPYINPTQQTFIPDGGTSIYFEPDTVKAISDGVSFTPNRLVASPVKFGSLPTGVDTNAPKPWQTLLFCPNPASRSSSATSKGAASDHYGFTSPSDHLYLEFFTMPVVEPYAISEPLSTAGKVNLNYQLAPFTNINRSTALRGVLKNTLLSAISGYDVKSSGSHPTSYNTNSSYKLSSTPGTANETHYEINRDATLAGLEKYYFNKGSLFRYPSEICDLYLVPSAISGASYHPQAARPPTTYDGMAAWWQPTDLSKMFMTGDNLREEPYDRLYPRLTTKSNTYTIHYRVQTLQKRSSTDPQQAATWEEGKDAVVAEYRGSSTIERYVDPNDPTLDSSWDSDTINVNMSGKADLSRLYKFRVINTKKFAP